MSDDAITTEPTDPQHQQRIDGNTAGAISTLSTRISDWAERKGFHEPEQNAERLESIASLLRGTTDEAMDATIGGSIVQKVHDDLMRIATEHRTLHLGMKLALIHSEISEALETLRDTGADNLGDGNFHEEIADAAIRILDLAGMIRANLGDEIMDKMAVNEDRPYKHGRVV